jgi:hypothetical protein
MLGAAAFAATTSVFVAAGSAVLVLFIRSQFDPANMTHRVKIVPIKHQHPAL